MDVETYFDKTLFLQHLLILKNKEEKHHLNTEKIIMFTTLNDKTSIKKYENKI